MASDGKKGPIAITGVKPADPSKPPPRLELRDMSRNYPDQFNLLLLGLEDFQKVDEDEPLSFLNIAGIHGEPFEDAWPKAPWNKDEIVEQTKSGYCTHTSILFLTWHRPYLALFETALHNHVKKIAGQYKRKEDRDRYTKAAEEFRLPYWDWALPIEKEKTFVPKEVMSTTIHEVFRPDNNGTSSEIRPNPLAGYTFQKTRNGWPAETKRSRFDPDDAKGQRLASQFKGRNLTERVVWLLQAYQEFPPMSHNEFPAIRKGNEQWIGWGSLEDIHNSVHNYIGGQMGDTTKAAFDPIFWFHHCNIDRLFAIWQAIHDDKSPEAYVVPRAEKYGNRFLARSATSRLDTPLLPFTKSERKGDFYNSQGVRNTTTFGYVYPETQDLNTSGRDGVRAKVLKVYSNASFAETVRKDGPAFKKSLAELSARAVSHQQVAAVAQHNISFTALAFSESQAPLPAPVVKQIEAIKAEQPKDIKVEQLLDGNKYLEWMIDVQAEKHANGGDFQVHFFLGPPEDERPDLYVHTSNHISTFYTLGQDISTGCIKCQNDQNNNMVVTGQIPLTLALVERYLAGENVGLDVPSVEDYLKVNLHWRVTNRAGELLPRDSIRGLLVGVVTNQVTLPEDSNAIPIYAPSVVPRPRATTSADGGTGRGNGTGFTGSEQLGVV